MAVSLIECKLWFMYGCQNHEWQLNYSRSFYWLFLNKNELKWWSASAIYCENIAHTSKNRRIHSRARIRSHSLSTSYYFKGQRTNTSLIMASGWLKVYPERSSAQTTSVFTCRYHSTNAPYSSLSYYYSYLKDKRVKCGNFHAKQLVRVSRNITHESQVFSTNLLKESRNRTAATRKALAYFPS
jgi:hypothetical protein